MRLPILFVVCIVAAWPSAGIAQGGGQVGGGMGFAVPPYPAPEFRLTSNRPPVTPAPLSGIDDVLAKPVKAPLEFQGTPLRDVVAWIHREAGVAVFFDLPALADGGVDPAKAAATISAAAGLPLASVLDMVLRGTGLTWIVRDDLIEITTPEKARERQVARTHDVSDLADATGAAGLVELIPRLVAPETWEVVGGHGTIRSLPLPRGAAIGVRHEYRVQRQVAGFLAALRRVKATPVKQRRPVADTGYWSDRPAAAAARVALDKPVNADFQGLSLRNAVALLAKEASVPIGFDAAALRDAGIDIDAPNVTLALEGKPLEVVMNRILEPGDLVVEVQNDGLIVTIRDTSFEAMSAAFYPVDRLVGGGRTLNGIKEKVHGMVAPDTWEDAGGAGTIVPVAGDVPCLVVLQTTAGHREVNALLRSLPAAPGRKPQRP